MFYFFVRMDPWLNITDDFIQRAQTLNIGQLVHDQS